MADPITNGSVMVEPGNFGSSGGGAGGGAGALGPLAFEIPQLAGYSFVASFADAADTIPAWGLQPGRRDQALAAFWPNEPMFSSTLYGTVAKYAAFGWSLKGGPRTVAAMQRVLHSSEHGEGWIALIVKTLIDLYTQDNGAFIEVVRTGTGPTDPVVELNHLDTAKCVRTGHWDKPVVYYDLNGDGHVLNYWNVIPLAEMPSPVQRMRGIQYSALTRCLKAAQIMREINTYQSEKVSGRFTKQIHLVSGVPTRMIEDAIKQNEEGSDNRGLTRFAQSVIVGSLDPTANVQSSTLDLASLPDSWNQETFMHWYVTQLALAFGTDYQDIAPLNGRVSATGQAATVSHASSRGKGPEMFMRTLEHALNFHGVMPRNVTFAFGEQDRGAEYEQILLMKEYMLALQIAIEAGVLTPQAARQMAADKGFIDQSYIQLMGESDATPTVTQAGSDPLNPNEPTVAKGDPGPHVPPTGGAGGQPTPIHANSNASQTQPPGTTQRPAVPAASAA